MIAEKHFPYLPTSHHGSASTPNRNCQVVSLSIDRSWSVSIVFDIKGYFTQVR
jgi:hypothetical protein